MAKNGDSAIGAADRRAAARRQNRRSISVKIKLRPSYWGHGMRRFPITHCLPLIRASRGYRYHRPKSGMLVKRMWEDRHHAVFDLWCGNIIHGKFILYSDCVEVCARCEKNAVKAGEPSIEVILGHRVELAIPKTYKRDR